MLRWFLDQLCRQAGYIPAFLFQLYQQGREPSLTELLTCLEALLSNYDRVFFIVDAVDESKPREDTLRVLRDLVTDAQFNKIQLLVTSRLYIDIEQVLEEFSMSGSMSNPEVTRRHRTFRASIYAVKSQIPSMGTRTAERDSRSFSNSCQRNVSPLYLKLPVLLAENLLGFAGRHFSFTNFNV